MIENPLRSELHALINTTLRSGVKVRMKIDGGSMHPWLRRGDTVLVGSADADQLMLGDILVIRQNNDILTHRLIAVNKYGWLTKGDASPSPDEPVSQGEILGRVEMIERGNSNIQLNVDWMRTSSRFLAWLACKEAGAYQLYRKSIIGRDNRLKWMAWIFVIPFRLPYWILAALRR